MRTIKEHEKDVLKLRQRLTDIENSLQAENSKYLKLAEELNAYICQIEDARQMGLKEF
ncbi:MAG: hypothetical protein Q8O88_00725 [bacterium]|nr:hypothetical protein [bacterium]